MEDNCPTSDVEEEKQHQDNVGKTFPFQPTTSGNLKVLPNQVAFESNAISVLVANPRKTRVALETKVALSGPCNDRGEPTCPLYSAQRKVLHESTSEGDVYKDEEKKDEDEKDEYSTELEDRSMSEVSIGHNEMRLEELGFHYLEPVDWTKVTMNTKSELQTLMFYRIINYIAPDCNVRIGDDEFNCHLMVLQCYSSFFENQKMIPDIELPEACVSPKAFSIIYHWMIYPDQDCKQLLRRDNVLELHGAAQYLRINELEHQCWAFITNQETFSEDQAFFMLLDGKRVGNTAIVELMVPRISKFFLPLVSSKDFLDLGMEELCMILSSSNIRVHCEMEVFMAAVRWLMHDWVGRKASIECVMRCVRFGLIDSWQLVDIRRNPENQEFLLITAHPTVNRMIDDGIAFSIIKFWYDINSEDFNNWIDMLAIVEPEERTWTSDNIKYVHYHDFMQDVADYKQGRVLEKKLSKISSSWHCKPTDDSVPSTVGSSVQLQPGRREMPPTQYNPVPKAGFPYSHHRRDHPTHMPHTRTPPTIEEFLATKMANTRKDGPR